MTTLTEPATVPVTTAASRRRFHDDGFTVVARLVERDEALRGRAAAQTLLAGGSAATLRDDRIFRQVINAWRVDPDLRALTLHPRLLAAVREVAARPMRLWHDQLFAKRPGTSLATEFHQDLPYWPVPRDAFTVSAWIALGDIGEDDGCLTFLPGTHRLRGGASALDDAGSLVALYPDQAFAERVALPLRAGGCTLHQGYTAHRAGANRGDADRTALSVIFIAADTLCTDQEDALTREFGLRAGQPFPDGFCPPVPA